MMPASRSPAVAAFARRSSRSTLPWASQATTVTDMPAITAEAALVPWAEDGMRHTVRPSSPRDRWYALMASRPASSPCDPALGCSETAS